MAQSTSIGRAAPLAALLVALASCARTAGTAGTGPGEDSGRQIAPTMGFGGASWLDRPEREQTEEPEKALDALEITSGEIVADVGAGTGYFTLRIARRVGMRGRVVATDIEPRTLAVLSERAAQQHLSNIETRMVTSDDAGLDPATFDLVLMVDVYHELAHPRAELVAVRRALRAGGRLAVVEYRGEDAAVPIKPEHKMTRAQIEAEVLPAGYHEVEDFEGLRDQRILVFTPAGEASGHSG